MNWGRSTTTFANWNESIEGGIAQVEELVLAARNYKMGLITIRRGSHRSTNDWPCCNG